MSDDFDFELAELLRKQVPNDESIHSTLLRTLLAYDPNIKPIGVIGNSGLWMDAPFVQKQYQFLFYRYPDHVLLETIDTSLSVNGNHNCLFDNPAYYTYRVESTFFNLKSVPLNFAKHADHSKHTFAPLFVRLLSCITFSVIFDLLFLMINALAKWPNFLIRYKNSSM